VSSSQLVDGVRVVATALRARHEGGRAAVLAHPQYRDARRHLIDFLEHHAHRRRARELVIR
jgi:hypothetical protein